MRAHELSIITEIVASPTDQVDVFCHCFGSCGSTLMTVPLGSNAGIKCRRLYLRFPHFGSSWGKPEHKFRIEFVESEDFAASLNSS